MKSKLIEYVIENNLENELFTGKILWWSDRDGNGIIIPDNTNHEVYIDSSVITDGIPKDESRVEFKFNTKILHCACGKEVNIIK